jgi:hypothetical protein
VPQDQPGNGEMRTFIVLANSQILTTREGRSDLMYSGGFRKINHSNRR